MSIANTKPNEHQTAFTIKITALNAETGEFEEKLLTLAKGISNCLIGRHHSCDLVLDREEVSRVHGRICFQDGQCFYTDLRSMGGSQINGEQVSCDRFYLLEQNSLLRIGRFVLTIAAIINAPITNYDCDRSQPITEVAVSSPQPLFWNSGEITVRCIQAIAETHDVKTFRFVAESTSTIFLSARAVCYPRFRN